MVTELGLCNKRYLLNKPLFTPEKKDQQIKYNEDMTENIKDIFAIMTIMFWPVIPLFWIPVHITTNFFQKFGPFSYLLSAIMWLPISYLIYHQQALLVAYKVSLPLPVTILGLVLFCIGILLQLWTISLLGIGIIGIPQVFSTIKNTLVNNGPFAVVRHPTYLAHTFIFSGIFFITGVYALLIITIVDFITTNTIIIPLEEKELSKRFGEEYERYKGKVTQRFFPFIGSR
jgi:protein-S-isoprenylcysteine O-methyltransferase Ste14